MLSLATVWSVPKLRAAVLIFALYLGVAVLLLTREARHRALGFEDLVLALAPGTLLGLLGGGWIIVSVAIAVLYLGGLAIAAGVAGSFDGDHRAFEHIFVLGVVGLSAPWLALRLAERGVNNLQAWRSVDTCLVCGTYTSLDAMFCGNCGSPLTTTERRSNPERVQLTGSDGPRSWRTPIGRDQPVVCVCGARIVSGARFCGKCGFDLRRIPNSGHAWWLG